MLIWWIFIREIYFSKKFLYKEVKYILASCKW